MKPALSSPVQPRLRVIPRLDIKGPNLVKGIHLEGLRVLGKPERFAREYYDGGADELLYMDIVASLYGRNNLIDIVERTAREIFIPLTVGGGIRSLEDIQKVLRAGADKISINTAAIQRPEFIREASRRFGASTLVVSIEVIRKKLGTYECYTENGRQPTGVDPFEWAVRAAELGAGELLVTSVDREGTGRGFDVELVKRIAESVSIPVIAGGGAGSAEHVHQAATAGKAQAVAVASVFHYEIIRKPAPEDRYTEGVITFLESGQGFSRVESTTVGRLKDYLMERGVGCRPAPGNDRHE